MSALIFLLRLAILFLPLFFLSPPSARALDPDLPVTSFIRTDFTVENGLPSNVINAVLQTHNGFLWVGTDAGLVRFDGRQFTPIALTAPESGSEEIVRALAESRNGDLWVGTDSGLARIARSALDFYDRSRVTLYGIAAGAPDEIRSLYVAHSGVLWVGTNHGLFRFEQDRFARVSPPARILSIRETLLGHLLLATDHGFWEWHDSSLIDHKEVETKLKVKADSLFDVWEDTVGTQWFCSMHGLSRKQGPAWTHLCWKDFATQIYVDPRGTIWTHLATGFYRLRKDRFEQIATDSVRAIASDKDEDLWIGTNGNGLIRFKDRAVQMYTKAQGLPSNVVMTVLLRRDGSLWAGNNCGGLSRFDGTRFHTYSEKDGLTNSCVWSLAEDHDQNLWVGTWGGGLFQLANNHFSQYTEAQGLASNVVRGLRVARDGSLWIAADGGVSHLLNGRMETYTTANGLSSPHVLSVFDDWKGDIWAGTTKGLNHLNVQKPQHRFDAVFTPRLIKDPRLTTFGEDARHNLYAMDAPKGIALLGKDRFVDLLSDLDLFSMLPLGNRLWFASGNGLISIDRFSFPHVSRTDELPLDIGRLGVDDGLASQQCSIGYPNMSATQTGTLWVATVKGLARVETSALHYSSAQLATLISEVTIERTKRIAGRQLILPPGTHHVELHFDAISLKSPEKIHFQYRMEGIDSVWLDAGNSLTAVYSSIPIGSHLFHVRASNADGIWDPIGIAYPVMQQPFVYQTAWFRAALTAFVIGLIVLAYVYRLRQLKLQMKALVDERVAERTRIARDLHDTLLQSFQGLMFRFQAVSNLLPTQPAKAKDSLDKAIDRAADAITEGRHAVEKLRRQPNTGEEFVPMLNRLGKQLQSDSSGGAATIDFQLVVEGIPRALNHPVQEDVFRIAAEALHNAYRHACAKQIEVEVRFDVRSLRVRVRDDGTGIDGAVLNNGKRGGHWGLPGMRERARLVGAQFDLWSHPGGGTEIEICVPAQVAYLPNGNGTRKEKCDADSGADC